MIPRPPRPTSLYSSAASDVYKRQMRVSRSLRDTAYRVLQCKEAMMGENGREPSLEEIAKRMELPLEEVSRAMDAIAAPISLYDPVYSDGGDPLTVMDQVRDTKNTDERWIERIALRDAFQTLSEREKQILILRFYDCLLYTSDAADE